MTPTRVPLERVPTGIAGLDRVLSGGLLRAGIYMIGGVPGAGKTILGNQIAAHHVARGGRALFVTLQSESHSRMLAQVSNLSFHDPSTVGVSLKYLNAFSAVEQEGLAGLLKIVRGAVREHAAELLVLDGMVTAGRLAKSEVDYKRFINELQSWVEVIGCTVLLLTSAGSEPGAPVQPEHTMVDGIIELRPVRDGLRMLRTLCVSKYRGSGFLEGGHPYEITGDGLVVHPRVEVALDAKDAPEAHTRMISAGEPGLDRLLGGGVRQGSTTLLLGSSGAGKTILGLRFLEEGLAHGEAALHFGFHESPSNLVAKAGRLGCQFRNHIEHGRLRVVWQRPGDRVLDALVHQLLGEVERTGARRVFLDGLVGLSQAAYKERISAALALMTDHLAAAGVTTFITEETRQLFVRDIEIPTEGVSAIFDNIIFLRSVEREAELVRLISVMKTRDSEPARGLHQFTITDRGVIVGDKFDTSETMLTGVARPSGGTAGRGGRADGE